MNNRVLLWVGFVITLLIVCTQTPLIATLFALLVLGMIPGTDLVIPAWVILLLYPVLFVLGVHWIRSQPLLIGEQKKPSKPVAQRVTRKRKSTEAPARTKPAHPAKRHTRAAV